MATTKKSQATTKETKVEPKVYGWVAGKPAYLQEHPDNKKKTEENI
jgi:hypothetical protein